MPQLPVRETTIDGVTYRVKLLGGRAAFEASARAIGAWVNKVTPEDFEWLRERFADHTQVGIVDRAVDDQGRDHGDGRTRFVSLASVFDEHFCGGQEVRARMLRWYHFCIEANFGPFSDVLRGLVSFLTAQSPSTSPKIALGSAGGSSSSPD